MPVQKQEILKKRPNTKSTFATSEVSNGFMISIHREGQAVVIHLMSGEVLEGAYINADKWTVLIHDDSTSRHRLIYKHAIESIVKGNNTL